jgi:hypothetical protein
MMHNIHICIGDAHANPAFSNERFRWLGRLLLDYHLKNPKSLITWIDLGDFEDMPSLSAYDMGKRSYEGRRYRRDLEAAWEARRLVNEPTEEFNESRKRNGKKQYRPRKVAIGGNHFEGRINRATNLTPLLEGTIGIADGKHQEFGWEYVPFLEPINIDGITYQHYFTTGISGRPIAGEYPAGSLLKKQFTSCIQGHSHVFDICHRTGADNRRIWGAHCGCFFDYQQDWSKGSEKYYARGILVLHGVHDGDIESFEWVGIEEIKRRYS